MDWGDRRRDLALSIVVGYDILLFKSVGLLLGAVFFVFIS